MNTWLGRLGVSCLWRLLEEAVGTIASKGFSDCQYSVPFFRQSRVSLPYHYANFAKFASQAKAGSLFSSTRSSLHKFLFLDDGFLEFQDILAQQSVQSN